MLTLLHADSLLEAARDFARSYIDCTDLDTAEDRIQILARQIAGVMMSEVAAKMSGKPTYKGVRIECECGREARFKGYRKRFVRTLHGDIQVERSYYRCDHCGQGYIPWDREQGLSERVWTPRVKELTASICAALPYEAAVRLIERTTGLGIEESSAEEIVRDVGESLRREEQESIISAVDMGEEISCERAPERLYIGIDAAKAHTDGGWHDIKTMVAYKGIWQEGQDTDTVGDSSYTAAQETSEEFGRRVYTKAMQAGYDAAKERIVIADGADWIWNEVRDHLPEATKIIDYWHACEHIHSLARALYGEESPKGKRWADEHCRRLKETGPGSLLRAMKRRKPKNDAECEALRLEMGYFRKYRKYMDYPRYRARGMMIGSGPVESACKVIVGQRLKQAGMRWTRGGSDSVLAVRCALLSGELGRIQHAARAA